MHHSEHTIYTAFNKFGVYLWEIIYYYDLCYLCLPVLPVLICVTCVDLCYLCWPLLAVLTCYLYRPVLPVNILGKNCLTCIDVLPVWICVTCIDICYLWWPAGQAACVRVTVVPVFLHGYCGQQWRGGLSWQGEGTQVHGRSFFPLRFGSKGMELVCRLSPAESGRPVDSNNLGVFCMPKF